MSSYERRTEEKKSVYTFQEVGGDKYLDRPIYILVSENSFSLAESFTYGMKHFEKATIVGQTSAGTAHAIDFIEVNDDYLIQLPISYSIHPVTKKDWEGTGVIPHIRVGDSKSLKVAYLAVIDKLIPNAEMMNHKELLKRYNQIKLRLQNNSKDEKI